MESAFDPYYKWLGIPPHEQPPNHYRLLGLGLFESDADVIETAADRQMRHVQTFKAGPHSALSQKVLNELTQVRLCLLRPESKAAYDQQLQAALHAARARDPAAGPLRRAVALDEEELEGPAIIPTSFVPSMGAGPVQPADRTSPARSPWVLAIGGAIAVCLVAAVGVIMWRSRSVRPELMPLADQTVDEGQRLEFTLAVKDPKAAAQTLEYHLVQGAPPGMRMDRSTGQVSWTPSEEQGPGNYQATVSAAVVGSPHVFHNQTVRISVKEVPQSPQLDPVETRHITQRGNVLTVPLKARDPDAPTSPLRFAVSIEPAASTPPQVDAKTGLVQWQPSSADLGKTYTLKFTVLKGPEGSLTAQQTMSIALRAPTPTRLPTPTVATTTPPVEPMPPAPTTPAPPTTPSPAPPEPAVAAKEKATAPDDDAQKKAATKIEGIFGQQLASRKPEDRRALAKEFLRQAPGTTELAERYVLLVKARDLSVAANDVPTAWSAIDAVNEDFKIEALEQKIDALKKGSGGARTASDSYDHAHRSVTLMEQALREEKFDLAQPLVQPATASATKAKDTALANRIKDLGKKLKDQKKEYEAVQSARETLKTSPDDPAANFAVGRYQSLSREEWSQGLPLLVKGDNEKWAAAAKSDLANPTTPTGQVAAGDAWWTLAEAAKAGEKEALQKRAAHWYRQASPSLTGLDKTRLDKKLEKLPAASVASLPRTIPQTPIARGTRTPAAPPQPPALLTPQPADLKFEREVAENFVKDQKGFLDVFVEGQRQPTHVSQGKDLPTSNFVIYSLGFTKRITDDDLLALKDLKFIQHLSVLYGSEIAAAGITLMQSLPSLEQVSLSQVPVTDAQLADFRRLPRLKRLYVRYGKCSGSGLAPLSILPNLSLVEISSSLLNDGALEAAATLPALTTLTISGENIQGAGLMALRSCRSLSKLKLTCSGIDEAHLAALADLPTLSDLHLEGRFGDVSLAHVARIATLQYLHWEAGLFTVSGMKDLSASRSLQNLVLNGPSVSDELIKSLPALGRLHQLNIIDGKRLSDQGLEPLSKMTSLDSLMLQQAASITNEGMVHLAKIPGVQTVYVSGAQGITDVGLQHFRGRSQIRNLTFNSSQITDVGVQAFKQAMPNCTVSK